MVRRDETGDSTHHVSVEKTMRRNGLEKARLWGVETAW